MRHLGVRTAKHATGDLCTRRNDRSVQSVEPVEDPQQDVLGHSRGDGGAAGNASSPTGLDSYLSILS